MTKLHLKIENALVKMDFIRRYEELSGHFSSGRTPSSERLVYVEKDEVMSIIRALGYSLIFHTKEKFYKITEEQAGAFWRSIRGIYWDCQGAADKNSFRF